VPDPSIAPEAVAIDPPAPEPSPTTLPGDEDELAGDLTVLSDDGGSGGSDPPVALAGVVVALVVGAAAVGVTLLRRARRSGS
jgi:hypothetical protein